MKYLIFFAVFTAVLLAAPGAWPDELVDDFEDPSTIDQWRFSNGPEFPGAAGSFQIESGAGVDGSGAGTLSFDFSGGGNYVAVYTDIVETGPYEGISFMLKGYVAGTFGTARLVDETGQTHQIRFPMRNYGGEFTKYTILTGGPDVYWGGADDGVFHGSVTQLGIIVDKGRNHHLTGSIVIDDVMVVDGRGAQLDLPDQLVFLDSMDSEAMANFQGVNIHFATPDEEQLDRAMEAGFSYIRMDLIWQAVEQTAGVYNFSAYDQLVDALEARGMRALLIVDYGNELYYDGPGEFDQKWGPQTQPARDAYAAFAVAAAERYEGRDVELEIWNEPNITQFWTPEPNPQHYNLLASQTLTAVKEAVPSMKVVIGATSGVDHSSIDEVLSYGGLEGIDKVSIHPYRQSPPETFFEEAAVVHDIIEERLGRSDVPVISGEWGYSTFWFGGNTPETYAKQARMAIREILFNLSRHVYNVVWYDLKCDGPDPGEGEHNFGLLEHGTLEPRPAFHAVKAYHDLTADLTDVSVIDIPHGNLHGVAFSDASFVLLALWNAREGCDAEIVLQAYGDMEFFDMMGQSFTDITHEGSTMRFALNEAMGPVYVRIPVCEIYPCDAAEPFEPDPGDDVVPDPSVLEEPAGEQDIDAAVDTADAAFDTEEEGKGGKGGCGCSVITR